MAALTGTLILQGNFAGAKLSAFQISIAADNDTFDCGTPAVIDYWITSKTDNLADGPVADGLAAGVFTFGAAAAGSITLWIVHN